MMKHIAVMAFLLVAGFSAVPAFAAMDIGAITEYCSNRDGRNFGGDGKQPNGKDADPAIMALKPGHYMTDDGSQIDLTPDGVFVLTPSKRASVAGTDGDDIMMGKSVAGCGREQLSEAMRRNNIAPPTGEPEDIKDLKNNGVSP